MEPRGPAVHEFFAKMGGRGEMIKAPIDLQDLRRRIYAKAKAEPSWRFGAVASAGSGGVGAGLYGGLGLFNEYRIRRLPVPKALPA